MSSEPSKAPSSAQSSSNKEPYNAKLDPNSPEFDLDSVPPPPGPLPIEKLVVEPATFTGGFSAATDSEGAKKQGKKEGDKGGK